MHAAVNEATNTWVPREMFLLMPAFALLVMLTRRKSGRNYPQHLYFAMHVHAVAFSAATIVVAANIVVIPYVSAATKPVGLLFAATHFARAFRYAYETTWFGALWRTAIISTFYALIMFAGLFAVWFPVAWDIVKQPS
jgi:hypothetical protein